MRSWKLAQAKRIRLANDNFALYRGGQVAPALGNAATGDLSFSQAFIPRITSFDDSPVSRQTYEGSPVHKMRKQEVGFDDMFAEHPIEDAPLMFEPDTPPQPMISEPEACLYQPVGMDHPSQYYAALPPTAVPPGYMLVPDPAYQQASIYTHVPAYTHTPEYDQPAYSAPLSMPMHAAPMEQMAHCPQFAPSTLAPMQEFAPMAVAPGMPSGPAIDFSADLPMVCKLEDGEVEDPPGSQVVTVNLRQCMVDGCTSGAVDISKLCKRHGGGRRCVVADCKSSAASSSNLCKKHGGGKRCSMEGCSKSAAGGGFCKKHGGGKRCTFPDCDKSASSSSDRCSRHGGGPRCMFPECINGAVGRTQYCISHGGGRRCAVTGCCSSSQNSTPYCKRHGKSIDHSAQLPPLPPAGLKEMPKEMPFEAPQPPVGSWEHFIQYQQQRKELTVVE